MIVNTLILKMVAILTGGNSKKVPELIGIIIVVIKANHISPNIPRDSLHLLLKLHDVTNYGWIMGGAAVYFIFPFIMYALLQKQVMRHCSDLFRFLNPHGIFEALIICSAI